MRYEGDGAWAEYDEDDGDFLGGRGDSGVGALPWRVDGRADARCLAPGFGPRVYGCDYVGLVRRIGAVVVMADRRFGERAGCDGEWRGRRAAGGLFEAVRSESEGQCSLAFRRKRSSE